MMIKSNQKSLIYFTEIRETIACFLKKGANSTYIEETDISNYILQEMFTHNLADTLTIMDTPTPTTNAVCQ